MGAIFLIFISILGIFAWTFTFFLKLQNTILIKESNRLISIKDKELNISIKNNNQVIEVFNTNMKTKVFQLSVMLITVKNHYENLLSLVDRYINEEEYTKIVELIHDIDDRLKEIGFISNIGKDTSIIKNVYFSEDSDFSKN